MAPSIENFLQLLNRSAPSVFPKEKIPPAQFQTGDPRAALRRIALTTQPTPSLAKRSFDLILSHRDISTDLTEAFNRHDSALATCGARLERSILGTAHALATQLRLAKPRPLRPEILAPSDSVKFVVFTPKGHETAVIEAIARAGGGVIGRYDHCTFRAPGKGTYTPQKGARPWAGSIGWLETAEETRIESRLPRTRAARALREVRAAHPYEEVACDFYPLEDLRKSDKPEAIVGSLLRAARADRLAARITRALPGATARIHGDPNARLHAIAIAFGATLSKNQLPLIDAVIAAECQALIAPGAFSNDAQDALASAGIIAIEIEAATWETEELKRLVATLQNAIKSKSNALTIDYIETV